MATDTRTANFIVSPIPGMDKREYDRRYPRGHSPIPVQYDDGQRPPEARGKAAALSSYLAQGGTPFKMSGRFKKGPMKGKTVDEAVAQFERMWATAPDSIKEKYASRSQKTDLAPSERGEVPITNATLNASRPKPPVAPPAAAPPAQAPAPVAPPAAAPGGNSVGPVDTSTPADPRISAGNSFAELTTPPVKAPGATAQSIGADSTPEAEAKRQGKPFPSGTREQQAAALTAGAIANPPTEAQRSTQSTAPPSPNLPPSSPAPAPAKRPGLTMTQAFSANDANPFMNVDPAVDAVRDQAKDQAQAKIDAKAAADAQARNRINSERANSEAARLGVAPPVQPPAPAQPVGATQPAPAAAPPPIPSPSGTRPPTAAEGNNSPAFQASNAEYGKIADQRMAPGGPAAPSTYQGPMRAPAPAPTGAPVMARPAPNMDPAIKSDGPGLTRVNRLTGLPFGFRPGDALPKSAGADMQQRGADSQARQSINQANATNPPIAPPKAIVAPATDRYAQAQADYQKEIDPAKAKEMDKVYSGASSLDQAKITAQSLKRGADQTIGAPKAKVVPPVRRPVLAR